MFLWGTVVKSSKDESTIFEITEEGEEKLFVKEVKVAKETGTLSLQQIKRQDMLSQDFLMKKSK